MQKQRASGTKPHKRTSGSISQPHSASVSSNRISHPQRTSVPLAENPYVRSSSSIYSGGERAIFRRQNIARRNAIILCIMAGICLVMASILIGFTLGKDAAPAEADASELQSAAHQSAVSPEEVEGNPASAVSDVRG